MKMVEPSTPAIPSQNQQSKEQKGSNSSSQQRLPNTTICVPIVYGSIAFPLKKPDSSNNTHQWTLYVRGPNNEDLSVGIAKVVFQLHPSFLQPIRELTAPPFEVTEKGWGEFDATIRIVWRDAGEKAMVLTHPIKLYPPLPVPGITTPATTAKEGDPVIHDFYDEVVFTDPNESYHKQLMQSGTLPKIKSQSEAVQEFFKPHSDEDNFKVLLEAQKFLETELKSVKDRILKADSARAELDEALAVAASKKSPPSRSSASTSSSAGTKRKSSKSTGGSASRKAKTS